VRARLELQELAAEGRGVDAEAAGGRGACGEGGGEEGVVGLGLGLGWRRGMLWWRLGG